MINDQERKGSIMIAMKSNKQWSDMTQAQRVGIIVTGVVQIALLIATLVDIRRRPAEQINGSKRMWFGLAFINWIGPIAYFIFGRKR
jgi:ACR3 family arsenite efflux pump ArsB